MALTGVLCVATERRLERRGVAGRDHVRLAQDAMLNAVDRQTAILGYVFTGDSAFLALDQLARHRLPRILDSLVASTMEDAEQHARALELRRVVDRWEIAYAQPTLAIPPALLPAMRDSLRQADRLLFEPVRMTFVQFRGAEHARYASRARWAERFYLAMLAAIFAELAVVAYILFGLLRRAGGQAAALALQDQALRRQVDERQRLEQQLLQSQKLDALGRLAGGIAHDFNNLLTAITNYADLLIDGLEPSNAHRAEAVEIRRTASRATRLTRQLLAFSRQQPSEPVPLSLNDVITELEGMLRRLLPANIALKVVLDPLNPMVEADRGQLEQVIVNLVVNARDAMQEGGGTVTIGTGHAAGRATIVVQDTGIGMDAETRARIFEPFFTTKPHGEGTGLGLATAYGIVRQAGGDIAVETAPGAGATFTIDLPALEGVEVPRRRRSPAPVASGRGSETLLLVEDDEAVRTATSRVLRRFGYSVIEVGSGTDALDVLARSNGDIRLVLTDLEMPGMSGADLATVLQGWQPPVPVLIMSGHNQDVMSARLGEVRTVSCIEKPFTPSDLAQRVRHLLDQLRPRVD